MSLDAATSGEIRASQLGLLRVRAFICRAGKREVPIDVAGHRRLNLEGQFIGEGERAVPVAIPEQLSDQAHAELDGELTVASATGKLEARLDGTARLLVAVLVQREHREVVVGAQRLSNEVMLKRDRERLSEQRARLVGPSPQEQRLRVQRLGEHNREAVSPRRSRARTRCAPAAVSSSPWKWWIRPA